MGDVRDRAHYPSWGSKTRARRGRRSDALSLITPHGDRKLVIDPVRRIAAAPLITPHGDRKPSWSGSPSGRRWPTHYPSWGSKTGETLATLLPGGTSLPLMGIENHAVGGAGHGAAKLITPHGDRKLVEIDDGLRPIRTSLPLMGIENRQRADAQRRGLAQLITPHGDRKPGRGEVVEVTHSLSLPLMGIENHAVEGAGHGAAQLITPHGDRKLRAAPRRRPMADRLITPHGDRKPAELDRRGVGLAGSLPLMGIENPTR